MKILLLLLIFAGKICFGQNRTIDINNPISDIDISYIGQNGVTRLTVILNSIEVSSSENKNTNTYIADINVEGLIHWETEQSNSNKNILKNIRLVKEGSDKPFVFYADLYDNTNNLLLKSTNKNNWKKISFKLFYIINGTAGQTPTLNFYPPSNTLSEVRAINISSSATQKDLREGILNLKSIPSGTPFQITELEIKKVSGNNTSVTVLTESDFINDRNFSYNGEMNLMISTLFDIETINAKYYTKCIGNLIGNKNELFNNVETEVVFVPNFDLKVLNRTSGFSITLPGGANSFLDKNIETQGNGQLGIRFLNPEYQHVRPEFIPLSNGKFNIKLEGLQEIPVETSSTYFYTNGQNNISPPLTISKKLPKVSDFKFNGVKGDSLLIEFKLTGMDIGKIPEITMSGEMGNLSIGGNVLVKRDEKEDNKFNVYIDRKISNLVTIDEITKDLTFGIKYGEFILFDLTVTVYNQKLYDLKMADLKTETDKNKRNRDPEKIKSLVKDIVSFGTSVGSVIDDVEVNTAIEGLQKGNGDKIKATMGDIGRWALVAGKIVLPLII